MKPALDFGIALGTRVKLADLFDSTPGLANVWIFGSRGRGTQRNESDIDLAIDAAGMDSAARTDLIERLDRLGLMYRVDTVILQEPLDERFRSLIERDRKLFWEPRAQPVQLHSAGSIQLKPFQATVLEQLDRFLTELKKHQVQSASAVKALGALEGMEDLAGEASDFPKKTWNALHKLGQLPASFANQPYSSRFDGAGRAIPNVCMKIPTGGGKTLRAAASVARVFSSYLARHTGLDLWIVPNAAIYQQTLKTLKEPWCLGFETT